MDSSPSPRTIFIEALDRPAGQREDFLRRVCANDPALRREVEELLAAHDVAEGFLESAIHPRLSLTDEGDSGDPWIGAQVGAYRIEEQVGSGGMSRVYLAARVGAEFEQQVAIKLMRRGIDDREALRRFRTECQALARLTHPHIASMIDGGVADDGTPYLVMEYVDGTPIDQFCRDHALSIADRLRLFRTVCIAVHFAHKYSILHRDVKPSNIFVDRDGHVRLLDFGIARIIDPSADGAERTATSMRMMTPSYASPEQARGEFLTTATDVYSLGVVLYELLTGRVPLEVSSRSPGEIERVISETPPTKPSEVVLRQATDDRDAESAAPTLSPEARRLARQLRGDLDHIVLMALRKEPERRYASAERFAEDVDRYLGGLPVIAQADRLSYRVEKFVRRHAVGVSATAALMLVLIASTVVAFTLWSRAERARVEAEQNARSAQEVSDFLVGLFEVSDPGEARGNTITAREILDRGAEEIQSELADQPVVQARMMATIGKVHESLGLYEEARALLLESAEIRRDVLGEDHVDVAQSLRELSAVYLAIGENDSALAVLERARQIQEARFGPNHVEVAITLSNISFARNMMGDSEAAQAMAERAVAIFEATDPSAPQYPITLNNLAQAYRSQGNFSAAVPLMERSIALTEEIQGADHPDVARGLNNLGSAYFRLGDYAKSQETFERSLALMERVLGPDHSNIGILANNIALVAKRNGDLERARALYERSLEIHQKTVGVENSDMAVTLTNAGNVYRELGDLDAALRYHERAVAIHETGTGPRAALAPALQHLGATQAAAGDTALARETLERAVSVAEAELGSDHVTVAFILTPLAQLDRRASDLDIADVRLARAFEILDGAVGDGHDVRVACLIEWSIVQAARGDLVVSEETLRRAMEAHDASTSGNPAAKAFDEARYWAVRGESARAVEAARRANELGMSPARLARNDDLESLRSLPEFRVLADLNE